MKSDAQGSAIPFKEALRILWAWRQASIPVEVCFFSRPELSENVRVSIDGVVKQVDSEGIVTVSGDGREIDLDLRGSEITHAGEESGKAGSQSALDRHTVLQVKFPGGEICLIFPHRPVPSLLAHRRRPDTGREWLEEMLAKAAEENRLKAPLSVRHSRTSILSTKLDRYSKPAMGKSGPPLFTVGAFLIVLILTALVLTPSSVPKLLLELGAPRQMSDPGAMVWVIPQDGNYYCSGSVLNGRKPGKTMNQGDALTKGYQPALGRYCQGSETTGVDGRKNGLLGYYQSVRQNSQALVSGLNRITYFGGL